MKKFDDIIGLSLELLQLFLIFLSLIVKIIGNIGL